MSHELEVVNGVTQFVYAGEPAWHGLGTKVDPNLTPVEMMNAAGLNWRVEKQDAYYQDTNGEFKRAPKKQALIRSSDGKYLDIVSDNWNPVQNEDAFEFFHDYVTAGEMEMHTAGSLKDGKIIWGLAKTSEKFSLFGGKDEVESYLLLSNPHQFGRAVDVRFTPIRVVCNNTLSLSLSGKANLGISLNHRSEFDPELVKEALTQAHEKLYNYQEMAEFLAQKRYTDESLFNYFSEVFPKTTIESKSLDEIRAAWKSGDEKLVSRNAAQALELINTQPGHELGEGSWWQAFNTVTFMTNHILGHNADTRLQSNWFGTNKDRSVNALGRAIEYAAAA